MNSSRAMSGAQDRAQNLHRCIVLTGGDVAKGEVEVRCESIRDAALRFQKMGNRVVEPALPREPYSLAELGFGLKVIASGTLRLHCRDLRRSLRLRGRNGQ